MAQTKTWIRFYTIADYEEEERWLRAQHQAGWRLSKMTPPCFYTFAACEPEDVIYRLDFKNGRAEEGYFQLFADYGWEYAGQCFGWYYFRKRAAEIDTQAEGELFSDDASRASLVERVFRRRMLPILVVFLCCVLPQAARSDIDALGFQVFWLVLLAIYIFLVVHCGGKLLLLRKKYGGAK